MTEDLEKGRGKDKKPRKRRGSKNPYEDQPKQRRTSHPEEGTKNRNIPNHQEDADKIVKLKEENTQLESKKASKESSIRQHEREMTQIAQKYGRADISYRTKKAIVRKLHDDIEEISGKIKQNKIEISKITSNYLNKAKTEKMTNKLVGGAADGETVVSVARYHKVDKKTIEEQLKMGMEVESEHTDDKVKQKEIALDHIFEDVNYYTKLKKVEKLTNTPKGKDKLIKAYVTLGLELED